jgi:hypothetical protein
MISTIQPDDDEGVEQLEADRRDDEQIHTEGLLIFYDQTSKGGSHANVYSWD